MNPNLVDYGLGEEWVDLDSPASDDPDDGFAGISNQQVADEIERLRERIAELEKDKARLLTDWIKLCAAITRMPQEVECDHHRKGNCVIDTDATHREPLIKLFFDLQRTRIRAAIDKAKDGE